MQVYMIISLIFAIVIALFAIVNSTAVTVSFFFTELEVSLALVILASVAIGAFIMFMIDTFKKMKKNKETKELKKEINELKNEITLKEKVIEERDLLIDNYRKKENIIVNSKTDTKIENDNKNQEISSADITTESNSDKSQN